MSLRADGLAVSYARHDVLRGLNLEIPPGQITAIVGANASGKSTLLRTLARLLEPKAGKVLLDGEDIHRLPTREVAKRLGLLPQSPVSPDGVTVGDLVARGRYPHSRMLRTLSDHDRERIDWALGATGTSELRERPLDSLSGGQRQRAWIAMALAQDTELLLLDEPTTFLDLAHQLEVLDLLEELHERDGRTVVMVVHDLNQAARYAHHLVALRDGEIHTAGAPVDVVDAGLVEAVFGVRCQVIPDPVSGTPMCVPLARAARR
ncbi:MAG: ABC transporter ATP-binding protein [Solirubrobacteraceae bacterium]|nr:ABC transporter ATP-binding protein [Solirubrobacteraceae bacterium]